MSTIEGRRKIWEVSVCTGGLVWRGHVRGVERFGAKETLLNVGSCGRWDWIRSSHLALVQKQQVEHDGLQAVCLYSGDRGYCEEEERSSRF